MLVDRCRQPARCLRLVHTACHRRLSAFIAKLTVSRYQPKFTLDSNFTLASTSTGINPTSQAVTLKIGTFSVTIPPGSFTLIAPGTYSFFGVINGLTISAKITQTSGKAYTFDATANANLSKTKSPTTVARTIANGTATTTARAIEPNKTGIRSGRCATTERFFLRSFHRPGLPGQAAATGWTDGLERQPR